MIILVLTLTLTLTLTLEVKPVQPVRTGAFIEFPNIHLAARAVIEVVTLTLSVTLAPTLTRP